MNIVLTGFMASGKSAISRAIADMSEYTLTDTDDLIVKKAGMSINEIFEKYGEAHFRNLEREAVMEAAALDNAVIATGGGTVLNRENIELLRENGVVFNLSPDFSVIEERIERARATRPLMKNDSIEEIRKRFEDRKPFYDNCDHKIHITNGRDPDFYAAEILSIMEEQVNENHS